MCFLVPFCVKPLGINQNNTFFDDSVAFLSFSTLRVLKMCAIIGFSLMAFPATVRSAVPFLPPDFEFNNYCGTAVFFLQAHDKLSKTT